MIVFDFEYYYKNQNLYFIVDNNNINSEYNKDNQENQILQLIDNSQLFFKIWRNIYLKEYILKSIYIINHRNFNPNTQLFGYCRNYEDINSINWMLTFNHIGLLIEKVHRNDRDLTFCLNSIEKMFQIINKNNINLLFNEKEIELFYINLIRYYREYLLNYSDNLLILSVKYDNIIAFKLLCSIMTSQYPYSYSLIYSLTNRKQQQQSISLSTSSSSSFFDSNNYSGSSGNSSNSSSTSISNSSSIEDIFSSSSNNYGSTLTMNTTISGGLELHFTRNLFDTAFEYSSIEILEYIRKSKSHIYYLWDHTRSFLECFKNSNDSLISIQKRNKLSRYLITNQMENINLPDVSFDDNNDTNNNNNNNSNTISNNNNNGKNSSINTLNSYFSFFTNYFSNNNNSNNSNEYQYSIDKLSIPFIHLSRLIELDTDILIDFKLYKPTLFNYRYHDFNQFLSSQYKGSLSSIIFISSNKQKLFICNFILIFLYSNLLSINNNYNNFSIEYIITLIKTYISSDNNHNNHNNHNNNISKILIEFLIEKIIMNKNSEFNDHLKISILTEYRLYLNQINNNNNNLDNQQCKEIKEILNNNPYCFSIIFQLSYEYGDSNLLKYCLNYFNIKVYLPSRQNIIPELFCQCIDNVQKQKQYIKTLVENYRSIESIPIQISWFFISLLKDEFLEQVIYFYELMEEKGIYLLSRECLEEAAYNDSKLIIEFFIKKFKGQIIVWKTIINSLNNNSITNSFTNLIDENNISQIQNNNQESIESYEDNIKNIFSIVWNTSVTKIAAKRNNLSLLKLVDKELPNLINESTMEEAIENQNFEIVKFLVSNGYPSNTNCLLLACRKKDFKTLIYLMDNKQDCCDLFQLCEYNSNLIEYIRNHRKKDYESNRFGDLHQFESRIIREIGCSREICLLYAILSHRTQQEILDKKQLQQQNNNNNNDNNQSQQFFNNNNNNNTNNNKNSNLLTNNYSNKVQSYIKPSKSTLERFRYINSLSRKDHIKIVLDELNEDMNENYLFHLQFHLRSIFESIVVNGNLIALKTFLNHPWIKSKFPKIFESELQIIIEKTIQFGYLDMLKYFLEDLKLTLPIEVIKIVVIPNLIKNGSVSTLNYILKVFQHNLKIKKFHVELAVKYRKQHMIRYMFQKFPKLFNNPKQFLIKITNNNNSNNSNNSYNNQFNYFKQQHQNQFYSTLLQINNTNNVNSFLYNNNNTTTSTTTTNTTNNLPNLDLQQINNNNNTYNNELSIITDDINQWFLNLSNSLSLY